MIVDIGGGTTEIAVISLGGIVADSSIKVAGDQFTYEIQQYMRQQHNIKIGEKPQKRLKSISEPLFPILTNLSSPTRLAVQT